MRENTEKYLKAFDICGHIMAIFVIIKDEIEDDKSKSSKITLNPSLAEVAVIDSTLDIPHDIFRSMLAGDFLFANLYPIPDITISLTPGSSFTSVATTQSLDSSVSTTTARQGDNKEVVEEICGKKEENLKTYYQIKWKGDVTPTWEPLANLFEGGKYSCLGKIIEFHNANPHIKPTHNIGDLNESLIPLEEPEGENETEDEEAKRVNHEQLGIYCHMFVDVTPDENLFKNPPTSVIEEILNTMEEYGKDYPTNDPNFDTHQELVDAIDDPDEKFELSLKTLNQNVKKRHLAVSRRNKQVDEFIAIHRAEIQKIPLHQRGEPYPLAITEVGLTNNFVNRKKAHATHSGTTAFFSFWECVALFVSDGKYRWIFQPVCIVRDGAHLSICEAFFSRAFQSYHYLGGVNITQAGISATSAFNLNLVERSWALDKIRYEIMDENIAWAKNRLKTIEFVKLSEEAKDIDADLERITNEIEKKNAAYYLSVWKLLTRAAKTLEEHQALLEEGAAVEAEIAKLDRMKVLREEMAQMIMDGTAQKPPNER